MTDLTPNPPEAASEIVEVEEAREQSFFTDVVVFLVKIPLFALVTAIYFVVAGLIWISLIIRVSLMFSIGVVTTALELRPSRNLSKSMDDAIRFFPAGFGIIFRSIFLPSQIEETTTHLNIGRLAIEALWSLVVWTGLILFASAFYGGETPLKTKIIKVIQSTVSILAQ